MSLSKTVLLGTAAAFALAGPALAEDRSTEKQKEQYLYQQSQDNNLGANDSAIGQTKPNSGPGVQGAPDTRTGPSTRAPGGAESGASSGEGGANATTQPSQDSSGVQGFPDTRTGPSTHAPHDGSTSGSGSAGSSSSGSSAP